VPFERLAPFSQGICDSTRFNTSRCRRLGTSSSSKTSIHAIARAVTDFFLK